MSTATHHPWARTIVFDGHPLPATAIAIDHLGREPEMSEAASAWLWRFTICVGVTKSDRSENVIRFATEALDFASRYRNRLLRDIPSRFDGPFDAAVLDEWVTALTTMIDIARTRDVCSWTAVDMA
jgi:hypothetical protein